MLPAIGRAVVDGATPVEPQVPAGWCGHLVPNFSQWQRGDVLLVASDDSLASRGIQWVQGLARQRAVREAAHFTHAAVYIGDGDLIDVTREDGISRRAVWFYCRHRDLLVRRLPARGIPAPQIAAIAEVAARHVGEPYSVTAALFSKLIPGTEPDPKRLYCSTFVGLVVAEATGLQLAERRVQRPLHPKGATSRPRS